MSSQIDGLVVLAGIRDGQKKGGVEQAPFELVKLVPQDKWSVIEGPIAKPQDDDPSDRLSVSEFSCEAIHRPRAVGRATKQLHDDILEGGLEHLQREKKFPRVLTLGGDHSLAIGSISAVANLCSAAVASNVKIPFSDPNVVVVWVDAHADLNPPKATTSGHLHGCPVSLLLGLDREGWRQLQHFEWAYDYLHKLSKRETYLSPKKIMYLAARDLDDAETELLAHYGILTYTMENFKQEGRDLEKIMRAALQKLDPQSNCAIHLSLDIDGLDPVDAPATGTAVEDGLTAEEAARLVRLLKGTGRLVSMDLAEVNLDLAKNEEDRKTTLETCRVVLDAFTSSS